MHRAKDVPDIDRGLITNEGIDKVVAFIPELPAGKLFVMGDNRDISIDSRMTQFGLVSEEDVTGKVLYLITSSSSRTGTDIK